MYDAVRVQQLITEYGQLDRLDGYTPQSRGQRFNEFIAELLRCWGIEAQASVRSVGEIDVVFAVDGQRYVLEAKWEQSKADTGHLAKLQRRVKQRLHGTTGLFLAMAGYSTDALDEIDRGERLEVLLLDRQHFEAMLSGLVPPRELLTRLHDRAAFRGEAYCPLHELLTTTSKAPSPLFELPDELGSRLLSDAHDGISCAPLFTLPDSNQLGIAVGSSESRLLLTTQDGIIEVDLQRRLSEWAVPISNCHHSSVLQSDGSVLFTRCFGVGRFRAGTISVVGGGFAGATRLVCHEDGSAWVLCNGTPHGTPSTSITLLGERLGDEARHSLQYPPACAANATWVDDDNLVVVGALGIMTTNPAAGTARMVHSARSNPMGIARLGNGIVLTAADAVSIGVTDLTTGAYTDIARLALRPSVNDIAHSGEDQFYIASYFGAGQHMRIAVVRLTVPLPIGESATRALAEASRRDLSTLSAEVERIRAASAPVQTESERDRLTRLYNEARGVVEPVLEGPLSSIVESAGLRPGAFDERSLDGWPPHEYGGAASLPRWGIDTLRSPWLVASIGVVHRAQPAEDLNDLAVTVVFARMTADRQHTYLTRFMPFAPGSPDLHEKVILLRAEIEAELPAIIEDFLKECATRGQQR